MPQLVPQPQNTNFLQSTKFVLTFPRISNTQFFCQEVNLPGVSTSEIPQTTPFVDLYRPGDKLVYEPLNVTFIVNEDMSSWYNSLIFFQRHYLQFNLTLLIPTLQLLLPRRTSDILGMI